MAATATGAPPLPPLVHVTHVASLPRGIAHADAVSRLRWRPETAAEGGGGVSGSGGSGPHRLMLASGGADHSVRLYHVDVDR